MYKCCCLSRLVANALYRIYRFISSLVSLDGSDTFIIATQDTAQLDVTGPNPTIVYTADIRTTRVELVCSTESTNSIEALGENQPAIYAFRLTSKCSCWNGCKGELV